MPTILFTSTCGVEHAQISDQTPSTPTITSQAHVTENVISRSIAVPHRARLMLHLPRFEKHLKDFVSFDTISHALKVRLSSGMS